MAPVALQCASAPYHHTSLSTGGAASSTPGLARHPHVASQSSSTPTQRQRHLTSSLCPCLCPWTSGSLRKSLHQSCCCPPFPAPCHSCLHPPRPPHRLQHRLQHHRPWRGPPCTLCTCSAHSACGITGVHGAVGKVRGRENRTQVDAGVTGRTRRSSTQTHTFHAESSKTRMSRVTCA